MANDLNQSLYEKDEIDLLELIKIILDSKKLIISTILVFALLSVVYSSNLKPEFKSSTILEIGYYVMPDGSQQPIEKSSDLISYLNLNQFMNDRDEKQKASFKAIENKLILIETSSRLAEQNENFLSEITRDIAERHSNLSILFKNNKKDEISRQIEMIESEISFIKEKALHERQLKRADIEDKISTLTIISPSIDLEISQLEKIIIDDTENLSLLVNSNKLAERASSSPTLDQIIFGYKTELNALNTIKHTNNQEIKHLHNQLKLLENVTLESDQLFRLKQKKAILENELQILMTKTQVNTRLIDNIETDTIKPKTLLIISLGIIIGFITSIFLVFIIIFLKSFREVEA